MKYGIKYTKNVRAIRITLKALNRMCFITVLFFCLFIVPNCGDDYTQVENCPVDHRKTPECMVVKYIFRGEGKPRKEKCYPYQQEGQQSEDDSQCYLLFHNRFVLMDK
jgi:hypothetical protein